MAFTQPSQDAALFQACSEADVACVQRLVDLDADLNHIVGLPGHLDYPINIAAATGSTPLVRFLLDHGASVNPGVLREAAFRGDLQMTQLLLEPVKLQLSSAEKSRGWRWSLSAILKGATERGLSEISQALHVFRLRVDGFDESVDTGLLAAVRAGNMRSVKHFVSMGATNTAGALAVAAEHERSEIMQYLLRSFRYDPEDLLRPLIFSATRGHMPSVLHLVDLGAQDDGTAFVAAILSRALRISAGAGDITMMESLVRKGARGSSALLPAVREGRVSAAEFLLRSCTYTVGELSAALEVAIFVWLHQQRQPVIDANDMQEVPRDLREHVTLSMLLAKGARLSSNCYCRVVEAMIILKHEFGPEFLKDRARYTLLETFPDGYLISLAIYHQCRDMVKELLGIPVLSLGANELEEASMQVLAGTIAPYKEPIFEPISTPLQAAVMAQDEQMCRLLAEHGELRLNINGWCSYKPNKTCTSYYGSHKTSTPNNEQFEGLRFSFGKCPLEGCALSMAIRTQSRAIVCLLIEHGADPWMNWSDISVFDMAGARNMLRALVTFLRGETSRCGFGPNRTELEGGRNVIHWAATHGDVDLINDLSKQGARLDARDSWHRSPLHAAVAAGKVEAVKALLWAGASAGVRDLGDYLRPDELATKALEQTSESDPQWAERAEICRFLDRWVQKDIDKLDAEGLREEVRRGAEKTREVDKAQGLEELVDHLSDEDSVDWGDDDE